MVRRLLRCTVAGDLEFIGNFCRDGKQDFDETGVDQGGPCTEAEVCAPP